MGAGLAAALAAAEDGGCHGRDFKRFSYVISWVKKYGQLMWISITIKTWVLWVSSWVHGYNGYKMGFYIDLNWDTPESLDRF